jgi:hypothetical protein
VFKGFKASAAIMADAAAAEMGRLDSSATGVGANAPIPTPAGAA